MSVVVLRTVHRVWQARLGITTVVMVVALMACSDVADITGPTRRPLPVVPSAMRTLMIATVDLEAGTMRFDPATGFGALNSASGISAAMYGNQGRTVRLYNTPVVVGASATPGKKQFSAMVGVQNLLPHPIGDEQAGDAPLDTIGIDVFMIEEPTVTATSSACTQTCTVTMRDHHGVRTFTDVNQKFWHWNDRLGATGTATDTTRTRLPFTFEADVQVTGFRFSVLLNAPWPPPHETRYKIEYAADSLPTAGVGSRWRLNSVGNADVSTMSSGLVIRPKQGEVSYYRLDSLAPSQDAYIEARVRWDGNATENNTRAEPRITLVDGARMITLGVFSSGVGLVDGSGVLIGPKHAVSTTVYHSYQLRKYATDSAVFYVDEIRGGAMAYAALPLSPFGTTSRVQFGAVNQQKPNTSTWDYVTYEIGVPKP
jgi:hypothetical protein